MLIPVLVYYTAKQWTIGIAGGYNQRLRQQVYVGLLDQLLLFVLP